MSGAVLRIIKDPIRKYSILGDDRLSTKLNLLLRSDSILLGHIRYYELVKTDLEVLARFFIKLKIFKKNINLPNSEFLSNNGFYLPSGLGITNKEIIYTCKVLNSIFKK